MSKYYFAYGSNLDIEAMRLRCPTAKKVGKGELPNYKLSFRGGIGQSYLTVDPNFGSSVPIGAWQIEDKDEKALDYYEGFPHFYKKTEMTLEVETEKGIEEINGLIYIMVEGYLENAPSLPYIQTCEQGYIDFGLNMSPLEKAYKSAYASSVEQMQNK